MKNIYLVVGKSGSGKSTIVQELCKRYGYKEVQSYTERPKRFEGETGHVFVSGEEFDKLGELCAYTLFNGNRYGVPSSVVDDSDLYVIDVAGVECMRKHYKGKKNIVVIGICCSDDAEADMSARMYRMCARGDSEADVAKRIEHDEIAFIDFKKIIDYKVINIDVDEAVKNIKNLIDNCER